MTLAIHKPTIIAPVHPESFGSDCFEVVARLNKVRRDGYFLAVPLSMLWKHSDSVDGFIKRYGKPRIFFLKRDADYNALIENQRQQPWKALVDRMFLFEHWDEVTRIMHAWGCDMEDQTIATAFIEADKLVVIDCRLKRLEIKFSQLDSLSSVEEHERGNFVIGKWGEHLYWPSCDLHVDVIDAIRYRTDKNYQRTRDLQTLAQNKEYGRAVQTLRKRCGLTREDIQNLGDISAKTIQRVETGETELSLKTFDALAKAHKMNTNSYLNLLAEITQRLRGSEDATFLETRDRIA